MAKLAEKRITYSDLCDIPENMVGRIINGELIVTPRPSRKHAHAAMALGT